MTRTEFETMNDQRRERMLRELQSDMADLVRSGDITPEKANQWVNDKADQWKGDHE
jgi:hypothetical protein